ncbi:MAG TPA: ATP-binding protein [Bacteroidales bacterium]|nr:ATP-binding protein [Bacteroidales bacterium]
MNYKASIPEKIIPRQHYLASSVKFLEKDMIKIFAGQRRVGKSYMLFQMINYVQQHYKKPNIIYINKELPEFREIRNDKDLIDFVHSCFSGKINFLFIDEVQEIEDFHKALRSLMAQKKYDIWCTGSNAAMLSDDISGLMSGRSITINVYALSYREFLLFHNLPQGNDALDRYLRYGGMPFLHNIGLEDELVFEYLKGIYSTILFKDIVARQNIRNTGFVENLLSFAADNTGSIVSAKKISDFLRSEKINISPVRVIEYLKYMVNAFVLFRCKRADIQGKKIFEFGEKYYFEDLGLRNIINGYKFNDIGKIIENAVFLHAKYHGYDVFTGSSGTKEIDFICEKNHRRKYIQVAYSLSDKKVYEREFGNLKAIRDHHPKYVVTMTPWKIDNDEGIEHFQLEDFLLNDL